MQMGVQVDRAEDAFAADLEVAGEIQGADWSLDRRDNSSFIKTAALLEAGEKVRWAADGAILTTTSSGFDAARWELKKPRVGLYEPWMANMDTGWTQWVLDEFRVPYSLLRNDDFRQGGLRSRFDTIVLASQSMSSLLHGYREGEFATRRTGETSTPQRPEFTGGIGLAGAAELQQFVRAGGTLVAFDNASDLPVQLFPLPLRQIVEAGDSGAGSGYYIPGSIIRITVDTKQPIAFGMPEEAFAFQSGGQAFDVTLTATYTNPEFQARRVASYATKNLLASGWVSGERLVLGKPILVDASYGRGRVVLFGFRPQFRGQSFGTFKLLLNTIYLGSAAVLR
jgi:hypothetical protein